MDINDVTVVPAVGPHWWKGSSIVYLLYEGFTTAVERGPIVPEEANSPSRV